MPGAYTVVESHPGVPILVSQFPYQSMFGDLVGIRLSVVNHVSEFPMGGVQEVPYTAGRAVGVRNRDPDCVEKTYPITVANFASSNETWSMSQEISWESSVEIGMEFGLQYSGTEASIGLSSTSSWSETTAHENSVAVGLGNSTEITIQGVTPPCHVYTVEPYVEVQDYNIIVQYWSTVYDINAYWDLDGDGHWDTRGVFSIACGTGNSGLRTAIGTARVVVGGPFIDDLGASPIS